MKHKPAAGAAGTVSAAAVLRAMQQVRRQGDCRIMDALEKAEPELAEYIMEEFSDIHRHILELGGPAKLSQSVQRQIQTMALVIVRAMQSGTPQRHKIGS